MLRFAEEILLLLLDENRGDLTPVPGWSLSCALAGAVLMDLALEDRIDTDVERLILTDSAPLGEDLLDTVLAEIAQSDQTHPTRFWVEHFAAQADAIREKALSRLAERGIVEVEEEGGFLTLSPQVSRSRRYPLADGEASEEVRLRVMRVLFSDDIPAPHDIVIITLVNACDLFERLLSPAELEEVQERIAIVSRLDLIGQQVAQAIQESEAPREIVRPAKAIPQADSFTTIRYLFPKGARYKGFLTEQYLKFGPIFRVRGPLNIQLTVMAGPEASQFYAKNAKIYFRSRNAWMPFAEGFGAERVISSMDGEEHFRLRRIQTPGFSRSVAEKKVPLLIDLVRREIASWPMDKPIPGTKTCQRIIYDLSSNLIANISVPEYFEDLLSLTDTIFNTSFKHTVPLYHKLLMHTPRLRRARKRVDELAAKIVAAHDPKKRGDREPDLIDDLLNLHSTDPQFLPEIDLKISVLEPLWVSLHTAGHVAPFMLYALLKHPDLLQQAKDEANALFAQGPPTAQGLRSLDVIPRILMETLRLYTPASALRRTVVNSFEFAGCTVPAGESVIISLAASHSLPEYFSNPERFDIDRFALPRNEHKQPGVYHPYGIGTHRCLGGYLAEFMIVTIMATILHEVELALHPPNYKLKIDNLPTSHPNKAFKFKATRRRS